MTRRQRGGGDRASPKPERIIGRCQIPRQAGRPSRVWQYSKSVSVTVHCRSYSVCGGHRHATAPSNRLATLRRN
ncbi:unnamed protein product [Lampetra planeri]